MSETDVTLVMGKPVAGSDKDSVSVKLQELNLKMYEQELIDQQGYDSVETLKMLSPDELTQLADDCKMKPGHKKKFLAAFAEKAETKPATETKPAKPAEPAEPAEPAVDPNMIALQEQVAAMKKQQSTDRLKRDVEEREKKIKEEAEARREADRKEAEMRQKMADMQMEQMKMQMQNNMNMNLATQNQAQAGASPIVINNNNNNSAAATAAATAATAAAEEKAAAEKAAADKAAAEKEKAAADKAAREKDKAAREKAAAAEEAKKDPAIKQLEKEMREFDGQVFNWPAAKWLELDTAKKEYGVKLSNLEDVYSNFIYMLWAIGPAFADMAVGAQGWPASVVKKKSHPRYQKACAANDQREGLFGPGAKEKFTFSCSYNEPKRLEVINAHSYFSTQPDIKRFMDLAFSTNFSELDKGKKISTAKEIIAVAKRLERRFSKDGYEPNLVALKKDHIEPWEKHSSTLMQQGACCIVL